MCGIFGAIGQNINAGTIRALALINRERGTDSLGFFDNTGRMCKTALDPLEALGEAECSAFINRAARKGWFIAGHTRYATRGTITRKNAHPFRFGRIIGSHNGMVDAPDSYNVDSMFLFDRLNKYGGYNEALGDIGGYWGLTWFDGADFYIQAHGNSVYLCKGEGAWYYSSDDEHLAACVGKRKMLHITNGATVRFNVSRPDYERMPDFVSYAPDWGYGYRSKTNGKSKKSKKTNKSDSAGSPASSVGSAGKDAWINNYCKLDNAEVKFADALAEKCGYMDLYHFMDMEGIASEERAYNMLVDAAHVEDANSNRSWIGDDFVAGGF